MNAEMETLSKALVFLEFVNAEESGISNAWMRSDPSSGTAIPASMLEERARVGGWDGPAGSGNFESFGRVTGTELPMSLVESGDPLSKAAGAGVEAEGRMPRIVGADADDAKRRPSAPSGTAGDRPMATAPQKEVAVDPEADLSHQSGSSGGVPEGPDASRPALAEDARKPGVERPAAAPRLVLRDGPAKAELVASKAVEPRVMPDVVRRIGSADVRSVEVMDRARPVVAEPTGARIVPPAVGEVKPEAPELRVEMPKPLARGVQDVVTAGIVDVGLRSGDSGGLRTPSTQVGRNVVAPTALVVDTQIEEPVWDAGRRVVDAGALMAGRAEVTVSRSAATVVGRDAVQPQSAETPPEAESLIDPSRPQVRVTPARAEVVPGAARMLVPHDVRGAILSPVSVESAIDRTPAADGPRATVQIGSPSSGAAPEGRPIVDIKPNMSDPIGAGPIFGHAGEELGLSRTVLPTTDVRALSMPAVAAPPSPAAERVIAAFAAEIASHAPGEVELTLSPKELGTLRFRMAIHEAILFVHVTADRPETTDLVRRHMALLTSELTGEGFADVDFSFGEDRRQPQPSPEHIIASLASRSTETGDRHQLPPAAPARALDLRI